MSRASQTCGLETSPGAHSPVLPMFFPHTTAGIAPVQAKAGCFDACHKTQEARAYVFSDPRR